MNYDFFQNKYGCFLYVLCENDFLIEINYERAEYGKIEFTGAYNPIINWRRGAKPIKPEKGRKLYAEFKRQQPLLPDLLETITVRAADLKPGQYVQNELNDKYRLVLSVEIIKKGNVFYKDGFQQVLIRFHGSIPFVTSHDREFRVLKGNLRG